MDKGGEGKEKEQKEEQNRATRPPCSHMNASEEEEARRFLMVILTFRLGVEIPPVSWCRRPPGAYMLHLNTAPVVLLSFSETCWLLPAPPTPPLQVPEARGSSQGQARPGPPCSHESRSSLHTERGGEGRRRRLAGMEEEGDGDFKNNNCRKKTNK